MRWQSKRFYWKRAPKWRAVGVGGQLCRMACSLGFHGDGISFRVVLSQSFWLRVHPGGVHLVQPRWMPERRILGGGQTGGVSFWPFLSSSGWWRLISSLFLTRTSCRKTTYANSYYAARPGWVVSVSMLPLDNHQRYGSFRHMCPFSKYGFHLMAQDNYWTPANVHAFQPIHKASTSLSLANWPECNHKAHMATKKLRNIFLIWTITWTQPKIKGSRKWKNGYWGRRNRVNHSSLQSSHILHYVHIFSLL